MAQRDLKIGYQGVAGSFSAMACASVLPQASHVPYDTVEAMFAALAEGQIDSAMTAIENQIAGVVPAVRDQLPTYQFYATREHCQAIRFYAWANPGATLAGIKLARSHPVALAQCGKFLQRHRIAATAHADTAGAVQELAAAPDPTVVALASLQAGKRYGLQCLAENIADNKRNHTRFVLLQRAPGRTPYGRCISMVLATPRDSATFSAALRQVAATLPVVITRCDVGSDGIWSLDFDAAEGVATTDVLRTALTPYLHHWQAMGHFAPCRLRAGRGARADWFRTAA